MQHQGSKVKEYFGVTPGSDWAIACNKHDISASAVWDDGGFDATVRQVGHTFPVNGEQDKVLLEDSGRSAPELWRVRRKRNSVSIFGLDIRGCNRTTRKQTSLFFFSLDFTPSKRTSTHSTCTSTLCYPTSRFFEQGARNSAIIHPGSSSAPPSIPRMPSDACWAAEKPSRISSL